MADYNKLTVANLKALLKDRGIPQTGLTRKAQLIERLKQADGEADAVDGDVAAPAGEQTSDGKPAQAEGVQDATAIATTSDADEPAKAPESVPTRHATIQPVEDGPPPGSSATVTPGEPPLSTASSMTLPAEDPDQSAAVTAPPSSQVPIPSHEVPAVPPAEIVSSTREPSTQPSGAPSPSRLNTEEAVEDNRKRKRRSGTPAVVEADVANKKARQDEATSTVHLKEDAVKERGPVVDGTEAKSNDVATSEPSMEDGATAKVLPWRTSDNIMEITGTEIVESANALPTERHEVKTHAQDVPEPAQGSIPRADVDVDKSNTALQDSKSSRPTPEQTEAAEQSLADLPQTSPEVSERTQNPSFHQARDSRYAPLFAPPLPSHAAPKPLPTSSPTNTTPSIHPVTRALYIRNFMRPLHPTPLKSYLTLLATTPSPPSSPSSSPLELFHLDPIRTHALVLFATTTAAARVRAALHDRIWPAERDRKPLWVDFVPDERVAQWIGVETEEAEKGGRAGGRRWEVVYQRDGEGGVVAELREVGAPAGSGARGRGAPQVMESRAGAGPGAGATEGRGRSSPPTKASAQQQQSKSGELPAPSSFLVLDALFRSTAAKPKLYFQPVAKESVEKRLAELDRCTSRGWKGVRGYGVEELRRYSFEDGDVLVDGGTHYPSRRDKYERGGGYGEFRGGGRGAWRGR